MLTCLSQFLSPSEPGVRAALQAFEISYEATKEMKVIPEEIQALFVIFLMSVSSCLAKCDLKVRLTHHYYLLLGKFAEKQPELLISLEQVQFYPHMLFKRSAQQRRRKRF